MADDDDLDNELLLVAGRGGQARKRTRKADSDDDYAISDDDYLAAPSKKHGSSRGARDTANLEGLTQLQREELLYNIDLDKKAEREAAGQEPQEQVRDLHGLECLDHGLLPPLLKHCHRTAAAYISLAPKCKNLEV